jgi:predicted DNA binding CopG/RHH family protein
MYELDPEEQEILELIERDELRSVPNVKQEIERFRRIAEATFKKDRRINIRISSRDLNALQIRALEEGIPYQTLISSLIHKYVSGRLVEKRND